MTISRPNVPRTEPRPALEPIRIRCDSFFERNGLRMHYVDQGLGDPVVMVHGNPSWSIYYRRLVDALQGEFRCIVPDHIGCGLSDKPDDSRYTYTLSSRVDDLEALLEHLGIHQNVTLVVHDWGGLIGMGWATRHPEAIKRLVILNTAAFHLPPGKADIPGILKFCRDARLGAWLIEHLNAFSVGASMIGCTWHPMRKALRAAYQLPYHRPGTRHATLRFVQDIPLQATDPAWDELHRIQDQLELFKQTPALIGWGMKDFVFDQDFLAEWERRLPQAAVHRFAQAGHYVLEDAAEELIPLIQDFVRQNVVSGQTDPGQAESGQAD
ncbi:MAG: alpha/beta hydrolase [Candidatus Melainabacteria bacterium HGW-Melainabacteria-1]|nr:MAG: alpha/beta hydrolase [Candidatus Melainabacteria bacterium HGW-Melainabacteria-1]